MGHMSRHCDHIYLIPFLVEDSATYPGSIQPSVDKKHIFGTLITLSLAERHNLATARRQALSVETCEISDGCSTFGSSNHWEPDVIHRGTGGKNIAPGYPFPTMGSVLPLYGIEVLLSFRLFMSAL
jgi:hypothetical protein